MNMIRLQRYADTPLGMFATLRVEDFLCHTCENPWLENRPFVSCIPEGVYPLKQQTFNRHDPGDLDYHTYEICDVPDRYHILFHIGNDMTDTEGCVLPGMGFGVSHRNLPGVLSSRRAFGIVKQKLDLHTEWKIAVTFGRRFQ